MKKVFMVLAVAAFVSSSVVSCSGEKEEEKTENAKGGDKAAEGEGEAAH